MSTLDDKILGEKLHYYCSSSEEEDNTNEEKSHDLHQTDDTINSNVIREESSYRHPQQWDGYSVNTGPKGVIKDWQRYRQFENEKRDQNERQKVELMKKLSISCRSHLDEELAKNQNSDEDSDDSNDDFIKEYMIRRMHEMMQQIDSPAKDRPDFGRIIYLDSGQQFLEAIDSEQKVVTIICHIFNSDVDRCQHMNQCLSSLAKQYPKVKFCAIEASTAGMSKHFSSNGVPALLVYKAGNLLANFVRLSDELKEPFCVEDIQHFLLEHGVLQQSSAQNSNQRTSIRDCAVDSEDLSD